MPQKVGNGGHGQENYDPNTGQYMSSSQNNTGLEEFHTGSGLSNGEIEKMLLNGEFGTDFVDYYKQADSSMKQQILNYVHSEYDKMNTSNEMQEQFQKIEEQEWSNLWFDCESQIFEKITGRSAKGMDPTQFRLMIEDVSPFDGFWHGYMGAGARCFEFNKALRMGLNNFYSKYPEFQNSNSLNKQAIEERTKKLDILTTSYSLPKDAQFFRYVDENYLVSQFGKMFEESGFKLEEEVLRSGKMSGYKTLNRNNYSVQQISDVLQNAIQKRVKQDGAFTSFSIVENLTHMGKKQKQSDYKRIKILYDAPKGSNCYISHYQKESEGMFPRGTSYFIKDVYTENTNGLDRVVIRYGIKQ